MVLADTSNLVKGTIVGYGYFQKDNIQTPLVVRVLNSTSLLMMQYTPGTSTSAYISATSNGLLSSNNLTYSFTADIPIR